MFQILDVHFRDDGCPTNHACAPARKKRARPCRRFVTRSEVAACDGARVRSLVVAADKGNPSSRPPSLAGKACGVLFAEGAEANGGDGSSQINTAYNKMLKEVQTLQNQILQAVMCFLFVFLFANCCEP